MDVVIVATDVGGTGVSLFHSWDRSINTIHSHLDHRLVPEVRTQSEDNTSTCCHKNHKPQEH